MYFGNRVQVLTSSVKVAQYLNDEMKENSMSECKCCEKMKWEIRKPLAELSSAQLIIQLLQKEESANGEVGHGSSEFRNVKKLRNWAQREPKNITG